MTGADPQSPGAESAHGATSARRTDFASAPTRPDAVELVPIERGERAFDEAPWWPVTRLVSGSLVLLLALSMMVPVVAVGGVGIRSLTLLLPAMLATLGARALFEVIGLAAPTRGRAGRTLAAVLPALIATALMAGASAIVGVHWSPVAGEATAVAAALTLAIAGAARALEIRVRLGLRLVYVVGAPESKRDLARELARHRDARLVGSSTITGGPAGLDSRALIASVRACGSTVLVADGIAMRIPELVRAASELNLAGIRVRDLVSYYESEFKKVPLAEITPTWFLFDIASIHRRRLYSLCSRAVEVMLAGVLLLVSLPLVVTAAAWIKVTSRGPALYRQRRVGRGGAEFTLLKLRTMVPRCDADAQAAWATSETDRVTSIGKLLRRYRLDELPQLWNVVRGDMALVGPRPEQVSIVERLTREIPHYAARHCIRPGITGWAQVNLGYEGSLEGAIAKLQRDLYYVKHHGPRLDGLILWLTLRAVLAGRG